MKILFVCTTDSMIWNFLIPHINQLKAMGFYVECACSRTGFYFDELINKYGLKLNEICFARNPFKVQNIKALKQLSNLIKKEKFDFIHCHEPVGGALARLAGKLNKKFVLYTVHGFHFFSGAPIKHWILYYNFEYILSFFTDAIITICHEDFERAQKLHAKRVYYIPGIGLDFSKFKISQRELIRNNIREELGIKKDDFVLITVGEISIRKNQNVIIKAMNELQNKELKLIICGEGDQKEELIKLIEEFHLEENVIFAGFRKDIPNVLCAADIFIYPSLWEGLGIAGLEAMSSGLPIIGSNRRGIKDYIINEETGFLFEPYDYKKLAQIINTLIKNNSLLNKIGQAGQQSIQNFSIEKSLSEMEKIYKNENIVNN